MLPDQQQNFYNTVEPPIELRRASFGLRLGTWLLDIVILIGLGVVLTFVVQSMNLIDATNAMSSPEMDNALRAMEDAGFANIFKSVLAFTSVMTYVSTVLGVCYWSLEAVTGASLGKLITGLRIATIDGKQASTSLWVRRFFISHANTVLALLALIFGIVNEMQSLSIILGLGYFISCLMALSSERLALHDRISGTCVMPKEEIR